MLFLVLSVTFSVLTAIVVEISVSVIWEFSTNDAVSVAVFDTTVLLVVLSLDTTIVTEDVVVSFETEVILLLSVSQVLLIMQLY